MSKLALAVAIVVLSGCASVGEWRDASIDSTSESTFQRSVTQLDGNLPEVRRQMFRLALVDIARTGVQDAGGPREDGTLAYTDADFRSDLDGLTYSGVIALADRKGPAVARQYQALNAQRWAEARHEANRQLGSGEPDYVPHWEFWPVPHAGLVLSDSWKPNNGR